MSNNEVNTSELLAIDDLSVRFGRAPNQTQVVHNVSLHVKPGEKVALVGESGSGKSVTAMSVLRLHDPAMTDYPAGQIRFGGRDLLRTTQKEIRQVRGKDIAMIFQEPMTSLNPVYTIGSQLIEPLIVHQGMSKAAARKRMIELLDRTGIPEPGKRFDAYPHMLSGGQRQRVMIAMALACNPRLLIADEPTTALDVTVQLQIIKLIEALQQEFNMAVLIITHDLNLVKRFAERIYVMQSGKVVEEATVSDLFERPRHEYTRHLLDSQPQKLVESLGDASRQTLLSGKNLRCVFEVKSGFFRRGIDTLAAVDDVDITVREGETVGLVGESGSGKTTLGMCLLRLQACAGEIVMSGERVDRLGTRQMRPWRRHFQVVFQDPYSSLSPRMTVEQIVGEGLRIHFPELSTQQRRDRIIKVMQEVGLEENMVRRYPHEFSGGQRQRIAVARAVVLEPKLILLDEPTSALDVSVQKQVLELLSNLQRRHGISYLFITHDLKVIRAMAHRIMVMRQGKVVESGDTETLFNNPHHAYTRALLKASLFTE